MKPAIALLSLSILAALPQQAAAWGDDGHKTVALIAQRFLTPAAKKQINAMLAADTDPLTKHDFASEATWADRFRDSNHRKDHYEETKRWHFVDLETSGPDMTAACFGRQPPSGMLASNGDKMACVVDKIAQFAAELGAPGTDAEERLFALKFLLHFVGDMHQPLHASDNNDAGGNNIKVTVDGFKHSAKDELHGYWDTQFVDAIAKPPVALAKKLLAQISSDQAALWKEGTVDDWAMEAFMVSVNDVYGNPPLSKDMPQHLDSAYAAQAEKDVALQLSKAGVRLASVLNKALGSQVADLD
jgi:S1/P1 Nuclease